MKKRNLKIFKILLIVVLVSVVLYVAFGVVKNKPLFSPEDTSVSPEASVSPSDTYYCTDGDKIKDGNIDYPTIDYNERGAATLRDISGRPIGGGCVDECIDDFTLKECVCQTSSGTQDILTTETIDCRYYGDPQYDGCFNGACGYAPIIPPSP